MIMHEKKLFISYQLSMYNYEWIIRLLTNDIQELKKQIVSLSTSLVYQIIHSYTLAANAFQTINHANLGILGSFVRDEPSTCAFH